MAETLNRNRAANGCQFDIVNRAVAYSGESIRFNRHGFSSSIYAVSDSSISVPTTTLQTISQQAGFETFTLICDIEGAEHDLFEHEAPLIKQSATLIIIELHPFIRGQAEVDQLQTFIRNLGFEQLHQDEQIFVYRNTALS
jgi:FkbM family methyltransferase